jgi:hypothetical protein
MAGRVTAARHRPGGLSRCGLTHQDRLNLLGAVEEGLRVDGVVKGENPGDQGVVWVSAAPTLLRAGASGRPNRDPYTMPEFEP